LLEKLFLITIIFIFIFNLRHAVTVRFLPEVISKEYKGFLQNKSFFSDDKLYAWAGWLYINGYSLNEINFEHPPLAKYLIGFSELIFKNHVLFSLIFGLSTLIVTFLLSREFINSPLLALIPVLILSFDKLFSFFSSISMLDIYVSFFSLLSLLLFIKAFDDKKFFILAYIVFGLALACKWTAIFIFPAILIYCLLRKNVKGFLSSFLGFALSLSIYCLTYLSFFIKHSFQEFISLQIQMYNFQRFMRFERGFPPPFWILLNFLTGVEGPVEHAVVEVINNESGSFIIKTLSVKHGLSLIKAFNPFTWPLSFSSSIMAFYYASKRKNEKFQLIPIAFLSLIGLTSYGQVFIWYLLPALPLGFISLGYFIENAYKDAKNKKLAACLIIVYTIAFSIWFFAVSLPSILLIG
jgi:dolichyl-phosphate-mannose--protein O-mannosyl transferase